MKKLILSGLGALMLVAPSCFGQAAPQAIYHETPLLNGWNVWLTNATTVYVGESNVLYTTPQGQVVYSLDNITNWTGVNTNSIAPDPFNRAVQMLSDASGNIGSYPIVGQGGSVTNEYNSTYLSGLAIHVLMDNTNFIPIVTTNAQGQWYIPPTGTYVTNYLWSLGGLAYGGWPPLQTQWPQYLYPATTNTYPSFVTSTHSAVFCFQRGWNFGTVTTPNYVWDSTTNTFIFTATQAAGDVPQVVITNLPTSFVIGAQFIRLNSVSDSGSSAGVTLVNGVWLGQYAP
jgi:hypothetical protein